MAALHRSDGLERAFDRETPPRRGSLWVEEPVGRRRMPDPVRSAAVRAVLIVALAIMAVNVAVLGALAESWIAAPAMLVAVIGTVVATWAVLDVWVTRQVYLQRHGVLSAPSSAARASRRGRSRDRHPQPGPGNGHRPRLSGV